MWPILVYAGGWEAVLYLSYIHSSPLPTVSPAGPHFQYMLPGKNCIFYVLGDPEVTANILQITQPAQYRYAKLQYRFAVTSWSPSSPNNSLKQ